MRSATVKEAGVTVKKLQLPGKGKAGRTKLPTKRTINLASVTEEKMNIKVAVPAVILILLAAGVLAKFGVVDRLQAMADAEGEVASLRSQVDALYAEIGQYETLEADYAHYTYSGMTDEELALTHRADVIDMLNRTLRPEDSAGSWSISNNRLTIEVVGRSLQQINELARLLEADPMVDFCTVTNAVMTETEVDPSDLPGYLELAEAEPEETEGEAQDTEEAEGGEETEAAEEAESEEAESAEEPEAEQEAEEVVSLPVTIQSVRANIIVFLQNPTEEDAQ